MRLLPLVWWNLRQHGVEDPLIGRLEKHYRATRKQNEARLRQMLPLLDAFRTAGIPTLVLKGARSPRQRLCRPRAQTDERHRLCSCRSSAWRPASRTLEALGGSRRSPVTPSMTRMVHALQFTPPPISRTTSPSICTGTSSRSAAGPATTTICGRPPSLSRSRGSPPRILAPEDQLIHACVHGEKWVHRAGGALGRRRGRGHPRRPASGGSGSWSRRSAAASSCGSAPSWPTSARRSMPRFRRRRWRCWRPPRSRVSSASSSAGACATGGARGSSCTGAIISGPHPGGSRRPSSRSPATFRRPGA